MKIITMLKVVKYTLSRDLSFLSFLDQKLVKPVLIQSSIRDQTKQEQLELSKTVWIKKFAAYFL